MQSINQYYNIDLLKSNFTRQIYDSYNKITLTNINLTAKKINSNDIEHHLKHNKFMSKSIMEFILEYEFLYNLTIDKINIYFPNNQFDIKLLKKIVKIIELFKNISCKDSPNVYIWLLPLKKTLPSASEEKSLNPININSGMSDGRNIYIWRIEECCKVLVHELIHHYELDFGQIFDDNLNNISKMVCKSINLKNKNINLNEAYTEALATIVMCIIESNSIISMKDLLLKNLQLAMTNAAKILNYFGYKSAQELFVKNNILFRETTNAFSYYIIKSLLLYKIHIVIYLCDQEKNYENYLLYAKLIKFDNVWMNEINKYFNNDFDNTLKMTIFK